ncbi:P-loop NTPase fold protein [Halodesulfovibrio spirochaetisodalis]|uniref:KAP NTPase domain-containing protein n=1 Tax=Halodesulfovibrio spirochaetisodalis TaxID=1560234 RepID=A0A1B7XD16_9BACT|nr:P-loop NTPase fold protein [Halodesulfovibrio spirochaetisodalis]OBQ51889.1 hypothetical protein SP90_08630 [Halodesulfovibrio spirochaetisodalis]
MTQAQRPSPNKHIEEFLEYYCSLPQSPDYAILLTGKWGAGKTHFIKKQIKQLEQSEKKFIYVSLYGMTDCNQIQIEFFKQLHPVLSSKGVLLAGKFAKGFLRGAFKVDLDDDGNADGTASPQLPDLSLPEYLQDTESRILIFDDLERCAIPIETVLGYINAFVEHGEHKVIILANEERFEATKKDYNKIKEKVIGKTFSIKPEADIAYEGFIREVRSECLCSFFQQHKNELLKTFHVAKHMNLRHLRQATQDFDRLYEKLPSEISEHEELLLHFAHHFFALSFEIKSGDVTKDEIKQHENDLEHFAVIEMLAEDSSNPKELPKNIYKNLRKKYTHFTFNSYLLSKEEWVDLLFNSIINIDSISTQLKNSPIFQEEHSPAWVQLWNYTKLSDNEFDQLCSTVENQLKNDELLRGGEILHVAAMLISYSKKGLNVPNVEELTEISIKAIDVATANAKYVPFRDSSVTDGFDDAWQNKIFHDGDASDFLKIKNHLLEKEKFLREETYEQTLDKIIPLIKGAGKSFYDFFANSSLYRETPILHLLPVEEVTESFIDNVHKSGYWVSRGLEERYKLSVHAIALSDELAWFEKIIENLETKVTQRNSKISGVIIERYLKQYLHPTLKHFKEALNATQQHPKQEGSST